jgi:hypothetical protein
MVDNTIRLPDPHNRRNGSPCAQEIKTSHLPHYERYQINNMGRRIHP